MLSKAKQLKSMSNFQLVVKLAVITASKKIEEKQFGSVPRRDANSRHADKYWDSWDYGFDIVRDLVRRRRVTDISLENHSLWGYIDDSFRSAYQFDYQYGRPVTVPANDFEALCAAIFLKNGIAIGEYQLKPTGQGFITDPYGVDSYGTIWGRCFGAAEFLRVDENDCWSMAKNLYFLVNGAMPDTKLYGESAENLDFNSWSIYDPPYVPLRRRVELGYE